MHPTPSDTPTPQQQPLAARIASALRKRPLLSAGVGVAAVALLAWAALLLSITSSTRDVRSSVQDIIALAAGQQVDSILRPEEYTRLRQSLADLHRQVKSARSRLVLAKPAALVPGARRQLGRAESFLQLADPALLAAVNTMDGYMPVVQALANTTVPIDYEALHQAIAQGKPLFDEAHAALQEANALKSAMDREGLAPEEARALELLDTYAPALELAVLAGRDAPQAVAAAASIRDTVRQARTTLQDPSELLFNTGAAQAQFASLELRAGDLLDGLASMKASLSPGDAAIHQTLDIGIEAAALLQLLGGAMSGFTDLTSGLLAAGPLSAGGAAVLQSGLPGLMASLQDAQLAQDQLLDRLDQTPSSASPVSPAAFFSLIMGLEPSALQTSVVARAVQAITALEYLMGMDAPRTYILVGQNPDEIRATGGFLGVVAELHIDGGELTSLRYLDSVDVDPPDFATNPISPEPIFRYLWISRLLFRDANWNPHFPASATQLADLYAKGQGVQADGVIAATEDLILALVDALGSVQVPGLQEPVDADAAGRYIDGELPYACLSRHSSARDRRCFGEDLFQAVFDQLMLPLPEAERSAVMQVFLTGLGHKDMLVHIFDTNASELFWEREWNGAVKQVDHDYLLVVDSALPGHSRSLIQRRIQYQVRLGAGSDIQADLLLSYQHTGQTPDPNCQQNFALPFGCFWDYVRVYVPLLASDVRTPPIPAPLGSEWLVWGYEPADTLNIISSPRPGTERLAEIGGYVMVEPQSTVTVPIGYTLPARTLTDLGGGLYEYRLLVQRQPGIPDEPVDVLVQLPLGGTLVSSSPSPIAQQDGWLKFTVTLDRDQLVVVRYRVG
ncbi:MAG: DUF4012 domain-containing protein [Chloroflexi bacterium]|nr:DUF4012 domain-containing protein [Chloroflexota bacterium]